MKNSTDSIKVIGALLVGVIAGATLGILFAPATGNKTRSRIWGEGKKLEDEIKRKMLAEASVFRSRAEELEKLAKDKIDHLTGGEKHKADAMQHQN